MRKKRKRKRMEEQQMIEMKKRQASFLQQKGFVFQLDYLRFLQHKFPLTVARFVKFFQCSN